MSSETRKNLIFFTVVALVVALCIIFPRIRSFAGLAAREFRFFWWLILAAGLAIWLSFRLSRRR